MRTLDHSSLSVGLVGRRLTSRRHWSGSGMVVIIIVGTARSAHFPFSPYDDWAILVAHPQSTFASFDVAKLVKLEVPFVFETLSVSWAH